MKNQTNTNTHLTTPTQTAVKIQRIKLGIDVHADSYRVVRQLDNATPQPAQKFTPKDFLVWAKKQLELAESVHSCYEAGPLATACIGKGWKPWASRTWSSGRKTGMNWARASRPSQDRCAGRLVQRDWTATCKATTRRWQSCAMPTPAQELAPAPKAGNASSCSNTACGSKLVKAAASFSITVCGSRDAEMAGTAMAGPEQQELGPELLAMLTITRDLLLAEVHAQAETATRRLGKSCAVEQPGAGVGALTSQVLEREILDWGPL